jgi:hypothetical protein
VIAAAIALAGCGGGGASAPAAGAPVLVVVPDGVLREVDEACSGGEPFLYVHATAGYRIEDAAGATVAHGDLPEGKAIPALNHDPGVPRVPTFCRFTLHPDVPTDAAGYRLVLDEGEPIPLSFKDGRATAVLG